MTAVSSHHATGAILPAGARLGRYEVLAKLASGGMAVVYAARAQGVAGFQRLVALKVLHANLAHEEEFIAMFLDEARLAARIRHPNVVSTIDISDTPNTGYYLVMDYIEGDHLGRLLASAHKRGERIPVPIVLRIISDALGGLGAAHDLRDETGKCVNLVHRDVSPHNIMVGTDGVSRLTDFGVAKAEDRISQTRDGQVKGKLAYMAPEQASTGEADRRSDLFAMGVILWECLTGRRLFRAENAAATLNKLINGSIPPPSSIDSGLEPVDTVLQKALARDPAERFMDAEAFIAALENASSAVGGVASQRAVARLVKNLASEKLERDQRMIRSAERSRTGEHEELWQDASVPSRTGHSLSFSQSAARSNDNAGKPPANTHSQLQPPPLISALTLPPPLPSAMGEGLGSQEVLQPARPRPSMAVRWTVLATGVVACAAVALGAEEPTVTATPIVVESGTLAGDTPGGSPPAQERADAPSPASKARDDGQPELAKQPQPEGAAAPMAAEASEAAEPDTGDAKPAAGASARPQPRTEAKNTGAASSATGTEPITDQTEVASEELIEKTAAAPGKSAAPKPQRARRGRSRKRAPGPAPAHADELLDNPYQR